MMRKVLELLGISRRRRPSKSRFILLVEMVSVRKPGEKEETIRDEIGRRLGCRVVSFMDERGSYICDHWTGEVMFHSVKPFEELDLEEVKTMFCGF
jgi:hypothetical protein